MSPTWSRPCWSIMPPWRILAITSSPFSTRNVTPCTHVCPSQRSAVATFKSTLTQQTFPAISLRRFLGRRWEEQTRTQAFIERTHQVLAGHFANANHPDCVWGNRLVIQGCIHERTGAGGRGLIVLGSHRVVCFQERLQIWKKKNDGDDIIDCTLHVWSYAAQIRSFWPVQSFRIHIRSI